MSARNNIVVTVLRGLVSVGLLIYCVAIVDFGMLRVALANVHAPTFCLAIVVAILNLLVGALRFKMLLDPVRNLPYLEHVRQYFWAAYFNQLLPSSMGGDALRTVWLQRRDIRLSVAVGFVVLERIVGVYSLIFVALTALLFVPSHIPLENIVQLLALGGIAALGGLIVILSISRKFYGRIGKWSEAIALLKRAVTEHRRMLAVFCVSVCYQLLTVGISYVIALSLEITIPVAVIFTIVPIVWFATMIPVSLGGLGLREYAFISLFGLAQLSPESAMLLSLGTFSILIIVGLIGGAWFTLDGFRKNGQKKPPHYRG